MSHTNQVQVSHSPAPWAWVEENGRTRGLDSGGGVVAGGATVLAATQIIAGDGAETVYLACANPANRSLIEAAPDLLEVAEAELTYGRCSWTGCYDLNNDLMPNLHTPCERRRAAVKKARGDA